MNLFEPLCSTGVFSRDPDLSSIDVVTGGMRELEGTRFEVIFYSTWFDDADEFADKIVATGAATPVLHAEKSIGPAFAEDAIDSHDRAFERFETNCRFARAIGASLVVLHLWGLPHSDHRWERNLAALPRLLDAAEAHGLTLSVETILCGSSTPVDRVAGCVGLDRRAGITLDTAFLAMHDQLGEGVADDRLWETAHGVDHIHLKDYADPGQGWGTAAYLHPGEGRLDLPGFMNGLSSRRYSGMITLEAPALRTGDKPDVARIETSLDWIRETRSRSVRRGNRIDAGNRCE